MNKLTTELRDFSLSRGADLFGVADLAPAREFIVSRDPPGLSDIRSQFP